MIRRSVNFLVQKIASFALVLAGFGFGTALSTAPAFGTATTTASATTFGTFRFFSTIVLFVTIKATAATLPHKITVNLLIKTYYQLDAVIAENTKTQFGEN